MDISTFCLACHGSQHFPLTFQVYFSCYSKELMSSSRHLYTAYQLFPSEQHNVVCNQHLNAKCDGAATISLEVTTEIYNIANIDFILSQDTYVFAKIIILLRNLLKKRIIFHKYTKILLCAHISHRLCNFPNKMIFKYNIM